MPSSINPHYTFHYSQPDAYRFSHDSVFLARRVFELLREKIRPEWRVLDLCAGCGIVGLDFLFHCRQELGFLPAQCDFVEVQEEYASHFEENCRRLNPGPAFIVQFMNINYSDIPATDRYDLILSNPPYFYAHEGKASQNELKNRSRFFVDSDFPTMIRVMERALKPSSVAYFLTRKSKDLGAGVEIIGDIRGTALAKLTTK